MDINTYLQCFESRLSSYTGDDPLDPWDKFVEFLEQRSPADGGSGMSVVFDSLVQRFLNDERYANDTRYVDYCIKCASFYTDPVALYSYVFSKGVGTRTAALYVAWACHFEQKGLNEQADAVYQKAVENQAQPADTVLQEYRQFQTRTRSQTPGSGSVAPLQTSHLTNQMSSHREPVAQSKTSVDLLAKPPTVKTVVTLSRSENSGVTRSHQDSSVHTVSEYLKDELLCDGTELSFEEARAVRYFRTLQERQQREKREMEDLVRKQLEGIRSIKSELEKVDGVLANQPAPQKVCVVEAASSLVGCPTQQPLGRPPRPWNPLSSRRSLGLTLLAKPTFMQDAAVHEGNHPGPADTSVLSAEVSQQPSVLPDRSVHLQQPALNPAPTHPKCPANQLLHRPVSSPTPVPAVVQPGSWEHNHTHHDVSQLQEPEEKLNMSQGGSVNLSHVTPNTSLGFVQATPSRVLPSPTVNTREALDLIMDMFQAPTLLEDPFDDSSVVHGAEREFESRFQRNGGSSVSSNPPASAPFTIFQDDNDKENASAAAPAAPAPAPAPAPAAAVVEKPKPARALAEIPVSKPEKPNETPPDLMPDESAMWGARYNPLNSLAACPNNTTDFAMLAQFVSTPFTHKTPFSSNFYPDRENTCDGSEADDDAFTRHQPKKLSPIIEQSPSEETGASRLEASSVRCGTIVGEGLAATASRHCLSSSSITMVQPPPPAVLSFRDHTLCPTESSSTRASSWEDFSSPEQTPKPSTLPLQASELTSVQSKTEPFKIMEDEEEPAEPDQNQKPVYDVPMSPDCALKPDWMTIKSPEAMVQPDLDLDLDLDVFLSPHRPSTVNRTQDVHMSPEQPPLCADVPMSPLQLPTTPERGGDVSMDAETPRAARTTELRLVSDPWDNDLVCDLLNSLTPPLTAHPRCITWQCNLPNITPKMTISIGKSSLRVDCLLGQGAFATVYQATDPVTSERMALKVQKPANPWEFYIHTQLDARLSPDVRHLYGSVRSAHLFHNASVLLEELHNYGTLLNVVNMYKCLSDKVMPQPLVIYFTVCILHMVELLHSVHVVHADIKPDNILLGERFLENKCFESENVDHGLVLIDLGQSIDMTLFPQGAAFTAKCLTSGFQCTEMLSGKPWNYQTDYFGIAGTVYCLLFGTYMQVTNEGGVWRTNAVFRRNPHSDLWLNFFDTLLNIPDCGSLPSLRRLRGQLTGVLQQSYSSKLSTLKSRLVVQLLESRKTNRR
ncbi:mitotic checkpoint serine/threonine-protein kinase BUB1 isoform X2 [Solea solea]|uniref:mitotic checkpoint serine/threonine-protein kinase BUB1 isoform X2 n=1 Tax=Solea solea TaxID=90069 RepID=UPI00272D87AC|nr:mitotic checkpoint serine/threonine-protein kinase BUB1 isoform X2 [Solea solea]